MTIQHNYVCIQISSTALQGDLMPKKVHSEWSPYLKDQARKQLHMFLVSPFAETCGKEFKKTNRLVLTNVWQGKKVHFGFFSPTGKTFVPCSITYDGATIGYERCEPHELVMHFSKLCPWSEWSKFLQDTIDTVYDFTSDVIQG